MNQYLGRHLTAEWELTRFNADRDLTNTVGKNWPDNEITWCHDPNIDEGSLNSFLLAIKEYENALPGCLQFIKTTADKNGHCSKYPTEGSLYLSSASAGCYSTGISQDELTRRRNTTSHPQSLILHPSCQSVTTAIRELGRVLGLTNEHLRWDRDRKVQIHFENMEEKWMEVFTIPDHERGRLYPHPYDYHSIMHYPMHSTIARDPSTPFISAVNCDYDCPTSFGSNLGLS